MSALGQKRTFAVQERMSALPLIATVKADIATGRMPSHREGDVRYFERFRG